MPGRSGCRRGDGLDVGSGSTRTRGTKTKEGAMSAVFREVRAALRGPLQELDPGFRLWSPKCQQGLGSEKRSKGGCIFGTGYEPTYKQILEER